MALVTSPAILAYGRVLGSSWHALKQSSEQIARVGPPLPQPRAQRSTAVHRTSGPPQLGRDAVRRSEHRLSLRCWPTTPTCSSTRTGSWLANTACNRLMEEGGLLVSDLSNFSHSPGGHSFHCDHVAPVPPLNVAARFSLVVARSSSRHPRRPGRGGITADSRLLRAEPIQQAHVLNFCFTGFAGQSMLLLALAMITFWDSSFLPRCPVEMGGRCLFHLGERHARTTDVDAGLRRPGGVFAVWGLSKRSRN